MTLSRPSQAQQVVPVGVAVVAVVAAVVTPVAVPDAPWLAPWVGRGMVVLGLCAWLWATSRRVWR